MFKRFSRLQWWRLLDHKQSLQNKSLDLQKIMQHPLCQHLSAQTVKKEIQTIYQPLAEFFHLKYQQHRQNHQQQQGFLKQPQKSTTPLRPYVIGVTGSVASGKSTASFLLQSLLTCYPHHQKVDVVSTDHFLMSQKKLSAKNLTHRKGYPESYQHKTLITFLQKLYQCHPSLQYPQYAHASYDIVTGITNTIALPDILILEGVNLFDPNHSVLKVRGKKSYHRIFHFIDHYLYIDAPVISLKKWHTQRLLTLFKDAKASKTNKYKHPLQHLSPEEIRKKISEAWDHINQPNRDNNIAPYRDALSDIILYKDKNHIINNIDVRIT